MKPINGKFRCVSCDHVDEGELVSNEKVSKKVERKKGVVKEGNIFADYDYKCKKRGYEKSQVIERQPYISDEDTLTFVKCGRCGWTEQLARKIG
jgi:DNA-directed RNA polymerase subunit M/transcription elongation factor TFIIS